MISQNLIQTSVGRDNRICRIHILNPVYPVCITRSLCLFRRCGRAFRGYRVRSGPSSSLPTLHSTPPHTAQAYSTVHTHAHNSTAQTKMLHSRRRQPGWKYRFHFWQLSLADNKHSLGLNTWNYRKTYQMTLSVGLRMTRVNADHFVACTPWFGLFFQWFMTEPPIKGFKCI